MHTALGLILSTSDQEIEDRFDGNGQHAIEQVIEEPVAEDLQLVCKTRWRIRDNLWISHLLQLHECVYGSTERGVCVPVPVGGLQIPFPEITQQVKAGGVICGKHLRYR